MSTIQVVISRINGIVAPVLKECARLFVSMLVAPFLAVGLGYVLILVGHFIPTGKTSLDCFYVFVGLFVFFSYYVRIRLPFGTTVHELPPRRLAGKSVRRWRNRGIWLSVALCTLALVSMWLWADLVESVFAVVLVMMMHWYRRRVLNPKHIHGWILLYLACGWALWVNEDTVIEDIYYTFGYFYLAEWLLWGVLHCYALHQLLKTHCRSWGFVCAALLVIYFPVVELPGELARQFVGPQLTGHTDDLYYTKLRPNEIRAADSHRGGVQVFRRDNGLTFKPGTYAILLDGGGITGYVHTLRTPSLAFKLWQFFIAKKPAKF